MVPIRPVPKYPVTPALLVGSPVSHHHKYWKSGGRLCPRPTLLEGATPFRGGCPSAGAESVVV